jgi:hypothetical protein
VRVAAYTSFTFAYLGRARVLAETLKRHNPDWDMVAVITDRPPADAPFNEVTEPFDRVVWYDELGIPDVIPWLFKHNVVEACTAVKGHALLKLLGEDYDYVFYIDPDIAVLNTLSSLVEFHQTASITLTPHQLSAEASPFGIIDNEIGSLKHGVYNLGYVGVSNDKNGRAFARWWADRLLEHCYEDVANGIFTDQRWCDLVPALFDGVRIIRDPGFNAASWNLSGRHVWFDDQGKLRANESLLRFFHFTKMGPLGRRMTSRYGWSSPAVFEVWHWYEKKHAEVSPDFVPKGYWFFGYYEDGDVVESAHRLLYRTRIDLQRSFPDPFRATHGSYKSWLSQNND